MASSARWLDQRFYGSDIAVSGDPGKFHQFFNKTRVALSPEPQLRKGFLISPLPVKEIAKLPPRLGEKRCQSDRLPDSGVGPCLITQPVKRHPEIQPLIVMMRTQSRCLLKLVHGFPEPFQVNECQRPGVMCFGIARSNSNSLICGLDPRLNNGERRKESGNSGACGLHDQAITEKQSEQRERQAEDRPPSNFSFQPWIDYLSHR